MSAHFLLLNAKDNSQCKILSPTHQPLTEVHRFISHPELSWPNISFSSLTVIPHIKYLNMAYLERTISYFVAKMKGRDAKLFKKGPAFSSHPTPTLTLTSPNYDGTNATLDIDNTADGLDHIPTLSWSLPPSIPSSSVKEYLLIVEDADVPIPQPVMHGGFYAIPQPVMHGGFYAIPPEKTTFSQEDLEVKEKGTWTLKGGLKYAKTLTGQVYSGPRPLRGHGPHRYFFTIVALGESVKFLKGQPKKADLGKEIEGKVLGWGEWVGIAERK
jgi:phosphatidylethanolamine-binding protein (PEBP) family uncharacterized protein